MQIMPFEDAETYRFNPFDLTKVWPHARLPADRGRPADAGPQPDRPPQPRSSRRAFEPNNLVPGIGASPDKMLLGRLFSYADAHRYRIGANYKQLPVNAPSRPVHSYSKDGAMRYTTVSDPVYAPNSKGGPHADAARYGEPAGWHTDGDMVRTAYTLREEDDDWGQAGHAGPRGAGRRRSATGWWTTSSATCSNGVSEPVLERAFEYWRNVDKDLGDRIEAGVRAKQDEKDPKAAHQANPARSSMQHKA